MNAIPDQAQGPVNTSFSSRPDLALSSGVDKWAMQPLETDTREISAEKGLEAAAGVEPANRGFAAPPSGSRSWANPRKSLCALVRELD